MQPVSNIYTLFQCLANSWSILPNANADLCVDKLQNNICVKPSCVKTASQFLASIDESVDPCVDFDKFACGKWREANPIPEDSSVNSRFAETSETTIQRLKIIFESNTTEDAYPANMAKFLYQKCMDTNAISKTKSEPVERILNRGLGIGGWPMFNDSWDGKDCSGRERSLSLTLGRLANEADINLLLQLSVRPDEKDSKRNIVYIRSPSLSLSRDFYLNHTRYGEKIETLKEYMLKLTKLYGEDTGQELPDTADQDFEDMIQFETRLAELTIPAADARNVSRTYNKYSLNDLRKNFTWLNWDEYLKSIFPANVISGLPDNPNFIVNFPQYTAGIGRILAETSKRILYNFFNWKVLEGWAGNLDQRYFDVTDKFWQAMSGRQATRPRWKICLSEAKRYFGKAVGAMYVKRHVDDGDRKQGTKLVRQLITTFNNIISESDWMDDATKTNALIKSAKMIHHIAYPDYLKNVTALNEEYKNLSMNPKLGYFDFLKQYAVWSTSHHFRKLLQPYDRTKFNIAASRVNAFYNPMQNSIVLPAGMMQRPFYDRENPMYVNFGAIGMIMGHEITHGFDDQGGKYDSNGILKRWWSNSSMANYNKKAKCIIEQYNNYKVRSLNRNINGRLTQGENIADTGGLKIAYNAYKAYLKSNHIVEEAKLPGLKYNPEQLFFISYANSWCASYKNAFLTRLLLSKPHSPASIRITGTLQNSDEFAKAFNCAPSTPMNPLKTSATKCKVW